MRIKQFKWIFFFLSCAAAVLLGSIFAGNSGERSVAMEANPRISLSTEFRFCCVYRYCKHEINMDKESYIGMDRAEFQNVNPRILIREFSTERIRAELYLDQYCPEHEIVLLRNGKLYVASSESGGDILIPRRDLGIEESQIQEKYRTILRQGMVATSGKTVEEIVETVRKNDGTFYKRENCL